MLTVRGGPPGHSLALQRGADNSQADRFLPAGRASRDEEGAGRVPGRSHSVCGLRRTRKVRSLDGWLSGCPGLHQGVRAGGKVLQEVRRPLELAPRSSLGGLNCWGLQSRQRAASPTFQLSGGGSESVRVGEPLRSCRLRQSPPDIAGSPGSGSVGLWDQEWLPC